MQKSWSPSSYGSNLRPSLTLKSNLWAMKHVTACSSKRARFLPAQLVGPYAKGLNAVGSRVNISSDDPVWPSCSGSHQQDQKNPGTERSGAGFVGVCISGLRLGCIRGQNYITVAKHLSYHPQGRQRSLLRPDHPASRLSLGKSWRATDNRREKT